MKQTLRGALIGFFMLFAFHAPAALLLAWDFSGLPATTATTATPALISPTVGTGTLDVSAFGLGSPQGTNPERTAFAGTVSNVFAGSVDGNPGTALALANQSANGHAVLFSFSMSGYQDLIITFDTRGTATGFNSGTWSWSTDNVTFSDLVGVNTATRNTTFATATADFSSILALNDAANVFLRYTLDGATSSAGNNRLDNIQFNVNPVPEPSSLALFALAAAAGVVIRRRK